VATRTPGSGTRAGETGRSKDRHRAPARLHHDRVGRSGIDSRADLQGKALAALHRLQKLPQVICGFFQDPNLRYITE
jgi:hypothetical protein